MKREIILQGDSEVLAPGGSLDPGTSLYPWSNTPAKKLWQVWNNLTPVPAVPGVTAAECAYHWPVNSPTQIAEGFALGPTLARFTKVTITTGFDYSQSGPDNWWFPPDNSHGPRCTIILRKRDLATWHVGTGTATHTMVYPTDDCNVNINTEPTVYKLYTLTWEMTSHPEGGPWLLEDINDLAVGVEFATSNGPNGKAYLETQGSFFKIRVPYLTVKLEVEDLGGFVSNMRSASSLALRMFRRARNVERPETLIENAPAAIGERVYMSHPKGPDIGGAGWGQRRLERRSGLVLAREYIPEEVKVEAEAYDLRAYACLGWGVYRIDAPWNPELQGVALIEKGRTFTHERAQDAWSPRPGDGVLNRVLEAYPNVSFYGLPVQGSGDISICLRNYDLQQTGWSTALNSGSFTASSDVTVAMVEEAGYLSSCKLDYGAGGGVGGRERTITSAGSRLHVRIIVKNTSVPDPLTQFGEWYLQSVTTSEFWDEANRTWTGTTTFNPIQSDATFGEVIADSIDAPAGNYKIGIGRFSSNMGPVILHGAVVDIQASDGTVAGARTPLITLDATITRVADRHRMYHVWGRELWDHERGVAVCEFQPFWRAEFLPDATVKPILHAQHATTTWDALQYVAMEGTDDLIRFERGMTGKTTYQLDCPITGVEVTRAHVVRAWVRWLGSDGWTQYAPYSVEVGYAVFVREDDGSTGALVSTGSVVGVLGDTTRIPYDRSYLGIGCDEARYLDGYVRMWETRRNPIHGLEAVWRL